MPDHYDDLLDRDRLLQGRTRPQSLLFLLESWSGADDQYLVDFLASTEVFANLPQSVVRNLLPAFEPVHLAAGARLVVDRALCFVAYGRVEASWDEPRGRTAAYVLGAGRTVGEEGLLLDEPPPLSVRAVRDSLLLRLSAHAFERLAARESDVLLNLSRSVARRIVSWTSTPISVSPPQTIVVLSAGGTPVRESVATELARVLGGSRRVAILTAADVDAALGDGSSQVTVDDPRNGRLLEWLARFERDADVVIYEAGDRASPWSERCLRQADRVMLVGNGSEPPPPGGHTFAAAHAPLDLILLHDPATRKPEGTAKWLSTYPVGAHHHVRRGHRRDYERLARFLTGRAVGLVLGGGGPRGFAHLGVMQALDEVGVPIDAVGGTSIGSIMGALCALGWDSDTRVRAAITAFCETKALVGFTLPLVSLSSSRKLTGLLRSATYLGDTEIEDLWLPWFGVSADLSTAQAIVHRRGSLWRAVRASISLPGILPPVYESRHLLVDGGIVNNLPADVMHAQLGGGRIIAVDLQPDSEFTFAQPFEPTISGWEALLRRTGLVGSRQSMPGILTVLSRTKDIASANARDQVTASGVISLHLRPPIASCPLLDFSRGPELIEIGYRDALRRLDDDVLASLLD